MWPSESGLNLELKNEFLKVSSLPPNALVAPNKLIDFIKPKSGDKVLEIGCSTGQATQYIGHNCAEVHALDVSPSMLHRAKMRIEKNIELKHVTFEKLQNFAVFPKLNRKFDQILHRCNLFHVNQNNLISP